MPTSGRPVLEKPDGPSPLLCVTLGVGMMVGLMLTILAAGLTYGKPTWPECWHGMQIGSNDRC
jgi:hypothetical protein